MTLQMLEQDDGDQNEQILLPTMKGCLGHMKK